MGCASSVQEERTRNGTAGGIPEPDAPPPTDPRLPLTARQKFSLEKSWKAVQRSLEAVGMNALIRLFKRSPETQDWFPSFKGKTEEQLRDDDNFETHASAVMGVFDETVELLGDVDASIKLLTKTGKRHAKLGLEADLIWTFQKPLLEAIEELLDTRYSEKIEEIYKLWTTFAIEHMTKAMQAES
ncbi:globin CTT-VIIB-8-like [Patiria miniata]|uniref:Globin domain-containing protein n=1 Tax=Patiria miniata TaxID=46514 RepID=A0A914BFA2_PATMI|nr:globin CTT-VIIB-8-like [Patiria miniata]